MIAFTLALTSTTLLLGVRVSGLDPELFAADATLKLQSPVPFAPNDEISNLSPMIPEPLASERNDLPEFDYSPLGAAAREDGNLLALMVDAATQEDDLLPNLLEEAERDAEVSFQKPPPDDNDKTVRQSPGSVLPCGTYTLQAGYYWVRTPNYPNNYPNNYNCAYLLRPPSGGALTLRCFGFQMESNTGCTNDYLQVFGTRYCGTNAPSRFDYSYLRLNVTTNGALAYRGFNCLVQAKQMAYGAGGLRCGTYRVRPGTYTIRSDQYPSNYNNFRYCRWFLYGYSSTDRFTTTCTSFNVESHSTCIWDYLNVNGRRYCGTTAPSVSRSYWTYAIFSTDYSVTRSGFSCTIRVTSTVTTTTPAPTCRCGIKNRMAERIVGGQPANSGEYPWMAGLVSPGGTRTFCGGSLINDRYVLTAAHCTVGRSPSQLQVLLGDHRIGVVDGESRHSLSAITNHPSYSSVSRGWDFSLLRLSTPVTYTSRRRPICMPNPTSTYAGVTAIATGFGRTGANLPQSDILLEVSLGIITNAVCLNTWSFINNSHLCAGGVGGRAVCNGDSGGPLIAYEAGRWVLAGVVSFGRPCAFAGYPDGYGRVTAALTWIRANTPGAVWCT